MGILQVRTFNVHLDQTIGNEDSGYKAGYDHASMCYFSVKEGLLMCTLLVYVGKCCFDRSDQGFGILEVVVKCRVMFGGIWDDDSCETGVRYDDEWVEHLKSFSNQQFERRFMIFYS